MNVRAWWPAAGLLLGCLANAWAQSESTPSASTTTQTESQRRLGHLLQPAVLAEHTAVQSAWKDIAAFTEWITKRQEAVEDSIADVRRKMIAQSKTADALTRELDRADARARENRALFSALNDIQRDIIDQTAMAIKALTEKKTLRKEGNAWRWLDASVEKRVAETKARIDLLVVRERAAEGALKNAGLLN